MPNTTTLLKLTHIVLLAAIALTPVEGRAQGMSSDTQVLVEDQLFRAQKLLDAGEAWRTFRHFDSAWTLCKQSSNRLCEADVLGRALATIREPSADNSRGDAERFYPMSNRAFILSNDLGLPKLKLLAISGLLDYAPIKDGSLYRWTPYIDTGLAIANDIGDSLELARFRNRKAAWLHMQGKTKAATENWGKAENLLLQLAPEEELLEFYYNIGARWLSYPRSKSYEQAYHYFTKARQTCLEIKDSSECAYQALALVIPSYQLGKNNDGAERVAEFMRWQPQPKLEDSLLALSYVVTRLDASGQFEAAAGWCDTLIAAYRLMDQDVYLATIFGLKADVLTGMERYDDARAYYDSSAQIAQEHGGAINEAVQAAVGTFFFTNDRPDSAAAVFGNLAKQAAENGPPNSEVRYKLAMAEALLEMDSAAAALPVFREALSYCRASQSDDVGQRYNLTLSVGSKAFRETGQADSALYYLQHWHNFAESTLAYSDLLYLDSIIPIVKSER